MALLSRRTPVVMGLIAAGVVAHPAKVRADCPPGSTPLQLPLATWSSQNSVGSRLLAADGSMVATHDVNAWPSRLQVFRGADGAWTPDPFVDLPAHPVWLALKGDILAATCDNPVGSPDPTHVHLYRRDAATQAWSLFASIPGPGEAQRDFGTRAVLGPGVLLVNSIMISGQGPYAYDGQVLVYTLAAGEQPTLVQTVTNPQPRTNRAFGFPLAVDGDLFAAAAMGDNDAGFHFGAVYIFQRIGGQWVNVQKILPDAGVESPRFGISMSLHGNHLAVSALRSVGVRGDPFGQSFANGYVRVYEWTGSSFRLQSHLTNPNGPASAAIAFGQDVSIRGDRLVVGAMLDSTNGSSAGAGFVYELENDAWRPKGMIGLPQGSGGWFGSRVVLTDTHAFGVAPFHNQGKLAAAAFDGCTTPGGGGRTPCLPGVVGLMSYLMQWFQRDPSADFNGDGSVNVTDISRFLQAWFAGC